MCDCANLIATKALIRILIKRDPKHILTHTLILVSPTVVTSSPSTLTLHTSPHSLTHSLTLT